MSTKIQEKTALQSICSALLSAHLDCRIICLLSPEQATRNTKKRNLRTTPRGVPQQISHSPETKERKVSCALNSKKKETKF